jgi:hypothetical protein
MQSPAPAATTPRCARFRLVQVGLVAIAALVSPRAARPEEPVPPPRYAADSAVLVGVGGGVIHVDLPDPDRHGASFGTKPRLLFDVGYELRPWLELGADLGLGLLGQSDSLNAVIAQSGQSGLAHFTLVHAAVNVRARWLHGSERWAPYARLGFGGVTLSLTAPAGLGSRRNDPAWNVGGGLELYLRPRLVVRAEGLDVAQLASGGTRHHAAVGLTLLYALPRSALQ